MQRRTWITAGAGWLAGSVARGSTPRPRLRIGLTAVILADEAAFLARWAAYLGPRLGGEVVFLSRDEYQRLHDMLNAGQINVLWTCGYPYVRFRKQLHLLAVPLYHGRPTYQSYLIRHKGDASIRGWSDVRGKVFAYSDPLSNSGWLVAQGELAKVGIGPHDFKRTFFAHGHSHVAEAVAARLADAGSIDGYVWETMRLQGMPAVAETDVIWKSQHHGFPPLVTAVNGWTPQARALQATLLAMGNDAEGRALLQALNLDGFIAGSFADFESIYRLACSVPGSGVEAA